jgi:hypothetical protein
MTIGAGIFLIALGAILRYAVNDSIDDVNLETIGLILMIAGAAGIILGFIQMQMARRRGDVVYERRDDLPPRY